MRALLDAYYGLMDRVMVDEAARHFTPDARIRIANGPWIEGRDAIAGFMRAGTRNVERMRHTITNVWEFGSTVIFEVEVTQWLRDGRRVGAERRAGGLREVSYPGAAVCVVEDGKFKEQRIYADLSPLWG